MLDLSPTTFILPSVEVCAEPKQLVPGSDLLSEKVTATVLQPGRYRRVRDGQTTVAIFVKYLQNGMISGRNRTGWNGLERLHTAEVAGSSLGLPTKKYLQIKEKFIASGPKSGSCLLRLYSNATDLWYCVES